jgi:hypothetical protein
VKPRESAPIAKLGIRENQWEEPVNQAIQLYGRHIAFLSHGRASSLAAYSIVIVKNDTSL